MDLNQARRDVNRFNESKRTAATVKARVESELIEAKETAKYLSSTIEVMREVECIKQELAKLKLNKDSVLEEKTQAENKAEVSSLKMASHLVLVDTLGSEIEQINEEKTLVELATIEGLRELKAIQAQRKDEAKEYSSKTDQIIKKANDIKELEMKLEATKFEVDKIQRELELAKDSDKRVELNELDKAKKELASVKEQGFKLMESMDVVRSELKNVKEKIYPLKKAEEKSDLAVQKLNLKLLRAKAKLEEISGSVQRAESIASNLSLTLQQLKLEAAKSTQEAQLAREECSKIKGEKSKFEYERGLNQKILDCTLRELEEIKLSESKALDELNNTNEKTLETRVKNYHNTSRITISSIEYKYLKEREAKASEVADKKVESARVLIEALNASEREMLMKAEKVEREIRAHSNMEEEEREKVVGVAPSPRRTMNRGGNTRTPTRRGKFVKGSPSNQSTYKSPSFVVKRRREVMPSLAKFFNRKKSIERGL